MWLCRATSTASPSTMGPKPSGAGRGGSNSFKATSDRRKGASPAGNARSDAIHQKRTKLHAARNVPAQPADAALKDGELDLQAFIAAREFEIKSLEQSMATSKAVSTSRAFQKVPRGLRRRTASHNPKRVPRRLRARAKKEMAEDNTPVVEPRRRKPRTTRARIRAETAKRIGILAARQRRQKSKQATGASQGDTAPGITAVVGRKPRPKIRRNELNDPPKPDAKFRRRQINKTWLPTHLWHAKRARMTEPTNPLWRFAIPLTPNEKIYRPTHRSQGERGTMVWDMSYMSTIGLNGNPAGIERVLRRIGIGQESLWNDRVLWNPEPDGTVDGPNAKKTQRQVFLRIHPSAFLELFNELVRLTRMENPRLYVEDLRFEIGSIELTGRKGEIGDALACDFELLFGLSKTQGNSRASVEGVSAGDAMDVDQEEPAAPEVDVKTHPLKHLSHVSKTTFDDLITSPAASTDIQAATVNVKISMVGRGVVSPCARIYRLPSTPLPVQSSATAEVPSTLPPDGRPTVALPHDLRAQWLALAHERSGSNPTRGTKRPWPTDMEARKKALAAELIRPQAPYNSGPPNQHDIGGHPLVPDAKDLVGFVTSGSYRLTDGRGAAMGSIAVNKVLADVRDNRKEGTLCIVRNAGENTIRGGCLCESVRYTINFPPDHEFIKACRKQTGSLIFRVQKIPLSALTWDAQSTLGRYRASEGCARGFCSKCGSFLFWQNESSNRISMTVGCFDKDALSRYGKTLTYAERHLWCDAEIPGVTDHLRGDKYKFDDEDGEVVLL
ncbi:ribonucleases P/MRP protein subunit [Purpureocillium lavendulum]|uniref:Ribonucleases P/MRP protein subunit n=1 Tax=Purpureocillium lavendulum TaxID=1247861 RepID=A0AB34FYD2_9HYPO|nr:ribonucleases P/MRP protein subunit [Purpureocillium lavendulum]